MTVTAVSLLLIAGCGAAAEPEGHALAPMDLARIGTIGWHPDDIPGPVAILDLHRDGRNVLNGAEVATAEELREALYPLAAASRDETDPMWPSLLRLVIRCDRDVPWRSAQSALLAAVDPDNRIDQVLFGVLPLEGDREGTLALGLPRDRCLAGEESPSERIVVRVTLRAGGPAGEPGALAALLQRLPSPVWVSIDADGEAPVGFVLRVADAAFRAGVTEILLIGAPRPGRGDPVAVASGGPISIFAGGERVPPVPSVELPPVPRVDGLAGSVGGFRAPFEMEELVIEGPKPIEDEDLPVEESLGEPK